jgi:hypothetical protein
MRGTLGPSFHTTLLEHTFLRMRQAVIDAKKKEAQQIRGISGPLSEWRTCLSYGRNSRISHLPPPPQDNRLSMLLQARRMLTLFQ